MSRQAGLTLIELMVGVAISLFILAVVAQVFLAASTSFRFQNSGSRIQENARFAIDSLVRDVRDSGYQGCGMGTGSDFAGGKYGIVNTISLAATDSKFLTAGSQKWWLLFDLLPVSASPPASAAYPITDGLIGFDNGGDNAPKMPTDLTAADGRSATAIAANLPKPDAIAVRYADLSSERVVASYAAPTIVTSQPHGFQRGDVLVESQDCRRAWVFQMTNTPSANDVSIDYGTGGGVTPGNCTSDLRYGDCADRFGGREDETTAENPLSPTKLPKPAAGDLIARLISKGYYIAPASNSTDGTNSLWVRSFPGSNPATGQPDTVELMRGVQDMQIRYGYSAPLRPNEDQYSISGFWTAEQIQAAGRWDRVLAVQIELLIRSEENNLTTEPMTVQFGGQNFTAPAGDRHLYRPYSFTVSLRNRIK